MNKVVYLANPYGFSKTMKYSVLTEMVSILRWAGVDVWEPFEKNNNVDKTEKGWANKVALSDFRDVEECDAVFAIINGEPPDVGVAVEIGMAIALRTPTFLFRDDFRVCTDTDEYPVNLMLFAGIPYENWQDYFYGSIGEILDENKAFMKWVKGEKI